MYGMRPSQILCVTFTNKAAQEMRERITSVLGEGQAPFWLGTFHGLGARQLRAEPEVAQLHPGFDIRDADDATALIRRLMKAMDPDTVPEPDTGKKCDVRQVKKMGERIGHMKENLVTPEAAPAWVRGLIERRRAARQMVDVEGWEFAVRLYQIYQATLREQNAADFSDLLMWPTLALMNDRSYRDRWSQRFTSVMADEFQDVNRAQMLWLTYMSEYSRELFAVGDVRNQYILGVGPKLASSGTSFGSLTGPDFSSSKRTSARRIISSRLPTPLSRETRAGSRRRCLPRRATVRRLRCSPTIMRQMRPTRLQPRWDVVRQKVWPGMTWR